MKVYMTSYTMERISANHITIKEQHLENIKKIHIYNQKQLMLEKLDAHKQIYNQKMSRLHEQTLHQRGQTDGKQAQEKMFNIINHQTNAN